MIEKNLALVCGFFITMIFLRWLVSRPSSPGPAFHIVKNVEKKPDNFFLTHYKINE